MKAGVGENDRGWDAGWHHQSSGHKFEQAPGIGKRQGSLACSSPGDCKDLDMTEWLNNEQGNNGFLFKDSYQFKVLTQHSRLPFVVMETDF